MESKDLKVIINGKGPRPSISSEVIVAIMEQAERIDANLYSDITVKVQAGRPVLVEVLTKHKPESVKQAERQMTKMDDLRRRWRTGIITYAEYRQGLNAIRADDGLPPLPEGEGEPS